MTRQQARVVGFSGSTRHTTCSSAYHLFQCLQSGETEPHEQNPDRKKVTWLTVNSAVAQMSALMSRAAKSPQAFGAAGQRCARRS